MVKVLASTLAVFAKSSAVAWVARNFLYPRYYGEIKCVSALNWLAYIVITHLEPESEVHWLFLSSESFGRIRVGIITEHEALSAWSYVLFGGKHEGGCSWHSARKLEELDWVIVCANDLDRWRRWDNMQIFPVVPQQCWNGYYCPYQGQQCKPMVKLSAPWAASRIRLQECRISCGHQ